MKEGGGIRDRDSKGLYEETMLRRKGQGEIQEKGSGNEGELRNWIAVLTDVVVKSLQRARELPLVLHQDPDR